VYEVDYLRRYDCVGLYLYSSMRLYFMVFEGSSGTIVPVDPSGSEVEGLCLHSIACWDCEFESRRGRGCLSLVSVVCCQVEVSATSRSLVQRSTTECDPVR